MQYIKIDNNETIAYEKAGSGEHVLVMVHGALTSNVCFKPILRYLEKTYTVYMPDLPGFGESSYENPLLSVVDLSYSVHLFIKALGIENFYLLGYGMAGSVVMQYAATYKQNLKGIILIESCGLGGRCVFDAQDRPYVSPEAMQFAPEYEDIYIALKEKNEEAVKEVFLNRIFVHNKPEPEYMDELVRAALCQRNFLEFFYALCNWNISKRANGYVPESTLYRQIDGPTLLTWGREDEISRKTEMLPMNVALNAELLFLENTGHNPFFDCPNLLALYMTKFILKHEKPEIAEDEDENRDCEG